MSDREQDEGGPSRADREFQTPDDKEGSGGKKSTSPENKEQDLKKFLRENPVEISSDNGKIVVFSAGSGDKQDYESCIQLTSDQEGLRGLQHWDFERNRKTTIYWNVNEEGGIEEIQYADSANFKVRDEKQYRNSLKRDGFFGAKHLFLPKPKLKDEGFITVSDAMAVEKTLAETLQELGKDKELSDRICNFNNKGGRKETTDLLSAVNKNVLDMDRRNFE